MPEAGEPLLLMRDIMDGQLETRDGREIGRVDDVVATFRSDGCLVLTDLVTGPEALACRVSSRLAPIVHALLRGRFEHRIPLAEVEEIGPTLKLRGSEYATGTAEQWLTDHLLRFIPGSGAGSGGRG
jgi:hypothetical protein